MVCSMVLNVCAVKAHAPTRRCLRIGPNRNDSFRYHMMILFNVTGVYL